MIKVFFLFFAAFSLSAADETVVVNRTGKRIQLDGFLIDWKVKERRAWSGTDRWSWDALNTTEGVAGYFRCISVRCSTWTFSIDSRHDASRPRVIPVTSRGGETNLELACANRASHDPAAPLVIEWIVPWDSIAVDTAGTYAILVSGSSSCGDTLPPLLLTGCAGARTGRVREAPGILFWILCAAASASAAAAGFRRIRRRYCRTRTLRRESLRR
jgi:hypothetical protein